MRNLRLGSGGSNRHRRWWGVAAFFCIVAQAAIGEPPNGGGRYADQLRRECDELIKLAVRRPYGLAWAEEAPQAKPRGGGQVMCLAPAETPAAGFVLFWAGDLLDQADYKRVAYDAAKGIAAAQRPTGQVPVRPTFQPTSAGGKDDAAIAADRAPTRAALGLVLSMLEESGGADPVLRAAAQRSVTWMLRQQTGVGGWPQGYPPTTAPKDAIRVMRLDQPDFRDSTIALLLAGDVLQDNVARAAAERSLTSLTRMRIGNVSRIGAPLWGAAYNMDNLITDRAAGLPPGVSVPASRNAMQTLMAGWLVLGNPVISGDDDNRIAYDRALRDAAAAVGKLPTYGDGEWRQIYGYDVEATPPPPKPEGALFNRALAQKETPPAEQVGTWGMRSVLRTCAASERKTREQFAGMLDAHLPVHQRLAAALCGVEDQPFSIDWPTSAPAADQFLRDYPGTFTALEGAAPEKLRDRVTRLWLLYLRARIETKFGR